MSGRTLGRAVIVVLALVASGCSWTHHGRNRHAKCMEPNIGTQARNLPPLKVPAGMDSPDTRNAIKVPPLAEPERSRSPQDPCLSSPPSYKG
jgi:uncharacterized lipoprotein